MSELFDGFELDVTKMTKKKEVYLQWSVIHQEEVIIHLPCVRSRRIAQKRV